MLRVLAVAEAEAQAAAKWYEQRREGLGVDFLAEFGGALEQIERTPLRFPVISSTRQREFRRKTLPRFPYNVVYEIRGKRIFVLAVAHQHRKPDYWKRRKP
jgi:hypothetical protein